MIYYPLLLHGQCAFAGFLMAILPEAERAASEVRSLPLYPALSEGEVEEVADAVNEFAVVTA